MRAIKPFCAVRPVASIANEFCTNPLTLYSEKEVKKMIILESLVGVETRKNRKKTVLKNIFFSNVHFDAFFLRNLKIRRPLGHRRVGKRYRA